MKNAKRLLSVLLSLMLVLGSVAVGGMTASADGSVYMISNYAQLKEFASIVNGTDGQIKNSAACAKLMKDIVCKNNPADTEYAADWTPIGDGRKISDDVYLYYTGTFDGDGHVITGLTTPEGYGSYAGLFGVVGAGGKVQNVGLEGGTIKGKHYVGGVVGINYGTVTGCYNTGAVTATATADYTNAYAGGVVGYNNQTLTNSYNTGAVTATATADNAEAYAGGVAGFNNNTLTNSYNKGAVTATATADNTYAYAGGVVGYNNRSLTNSYNTGAVTATATADNAYAYTYAYAYAGGVVGYNNDTLTNCYYDSDICTGVNAIGYGSGTNVEGLTTAEMTGANALSNMVFEYRDGEVSPWLTRANTENIKFYPHLKGFAYDSEATVENWPPKIVNVIEYPLWVGGNQVTSDNMDSLNELDGISVAEGGSVKFVPDADGKGGTLTLNNATITGDYYDVRIRSGVLNLTIVLVGNNVLPEGAGDGILTYNGGNLKITGNGTLDVSGKTYPIYSERNMTIENASVVATSNGFYSIYSRSVLTVTNSYVSSESTGRCIWGNPLVLGEGLGITEPLGGQNSGKMITLNGQNVQKAVIQPAYSVELSANPTDCGSVSGAGSYAKDGATATVTATPNEHYNFVNWTENGDEVSTDAEYSFTVTGDRELVANFEIQKFTVQFVNDDGTELQSGDVAYGETPVYTGETPTKEQSDQYVYTFAGWSPEITSVTTDATYTATFTQAPRKYEIKFVNEDGTELQSSPVAWGETPKYTGETPTKTATAEYTYEFKGWSPEISQVSGEATYTATFREIPVDYKLTWTVDGESYKNETVPFGTEIVKPDDPVKEGYTFEWVDDIPATMPAEDVTIKGEFTPIEYTAKFVDENGETVKEVKFTVETEKLEEPEVPEKANYTGKWEDYELKIGGIKVKPVYTEIPAEEPEEPAQEVSEELVAPVSIEGNRRSVLGYKENQTFTADPTGLPEGAEVHWFVNGEDAGTGSEYTVVGPKDDYTIQAKAIDKEGNVLSESAEQNITVKHGFLDKILFFFAYLLKLLLTPVWYLEDIL